MTPSDNQKIYDKLDEISTGQARLEERVAGLVAPGSAATCKVHEVRLEEMAEDIKEVRYEVKGARRAAWGAAVTIFLTALTAAIKTWFTSEGGG